RDAARAPRGFHASRLHDGYRDLERQYDAHGLCHQCLEEPPANLAGRGSEADDGDPLNRRAPHSFGDVRACGKSRHRHQRRFKSERVLSGVSAGRAMTDIDRWIDTWRELGVADSAALKQLYGDVLNRYSEPHRHYHTTQHLAECFEKVQDIIAMAEHPAEVKVALWFHDAIYDTQRHDNEQRSAEWAREAART